MTNTTRNAFQQRVVEALIESKAVNLDVVGATLSKFGEEAALSGETLVHIQNRNFIINCGWPGPQIDIGRQVGAQEREA
jgi:hypothetical protein